MYNTSYVALTLLSKYNIVMLLLLDIYWVQPANQIIKPDSYLYKLDASVTLHTSPRYSFSKTSLKGYTIRKFQKLLDILVLLTHIMCV